MVRAWSKEQKKWVDVTTASVSSDTARSVVESLEELQETRDKQVAEVKSLKDANENLRFVILQQTRSLVLERQELKARILRIDQRINALGFTPEKAIEVYGG